MAKATKKAKKSPVEDEDQSRRFIELAEKLEIKLSFAPEQVVETLADLMTFLRVVSISGVLKAVVADPDDDKVLECAEVAGATQPARHAGPSRPAVGSKHPDAAAPYTRTRRGRHLSRWPAVADQDCACDSLPHPRTGRNGANGEVSQEARQSAA